MARGSTWMNALIGAAVTVVLSFTMVSPLLGGAVSGYLQRGDVREGAIVGGLSGVLATLPVAIVLTLIGTLFLAVPIGMDVGAGIAFFALVFFVIVLFVGLFTVGLSAVGGAIGSYVAMETDIGGEPRIDTR